MRQIMGTSVWRYVTPGIVLILTIIYFWMAVTFPADAGLMPLIIGAALLIMLPVDLISLSDTKPGNWLRERMNPAAGEPPEDFGPVRKQVVAMAWVVAFGTLMFLVGIAAAVPLYIAGSLRHLGGKSWRAALITAAIVGLCNYLLFQFGLGVDLYPGWFLATH